MNLRLGSIAEQTESDRGRTFGTLLQTFNGFEVWRRKSWRISENNRQTFDVLHTPVRPQDHMSLYKHISLHTG